MSKTTKRTDEEIKAFSKAIFGCRDDIASILFEKWEAEEVPQEAAVVGMMAICEEIMLKQELPEAQVEQTRANALGIAQSIVQEEEDGVRSPPDSIGISDEILEGEEEEEDKEAAKGQKSETC